MLAPYLQRFNNSLSAFQTKFPLVNWSVEFKNSLINDFSFYSARVEDEKLIYGDTIRFLNDEFIKKEKLSSLLDVSNHKDILKSLIDQYDQFELSENSIKSVHKNLMSSELSWNDNFQPNLVGNYRNIPVVGYREPYFPNKEYVVHFNLEFSMASHMDIFTSKFSAINNSKDETHLLTALAYFHNIFLNTIHPFADGNGRVCRIIMGTIMMKNNCPPVFARILSNYDMMHYINLIIECENTKSDVPFVRFLAGEMVDYMDEKIHNS